MSDQHYDIIGDVHGHADALTRLLGELGYAESQGVFRHETRRAIFVGDFVDRGPQQKDVLRIARNMCAAGAASAVLGNHEFNAIGWATQNDEGDFLRRHYPHRLTQHAEFLGQLGEGSSEHKEALNWFRKLPVWIDLPGLRVVHACWHTHSIIALRPYLDESNCFTDEGIREAHRRSSEAYEAAEVLLKGPEVRLPSGSSFVDNDGHERKEVRIRWWDPDATTFRKAAMGIDDQLEQLLDAEITTDFQYTENTPVMFGHYWMKGEPIITNSRAACLDFSVAKRLLDCLSVVW